MAVLGILVKCHSRKTEGNQFSQTPFYTSTCWLFERFCRSRHRWLTMGKNCRQVNRPGAANIFNCMHLQDFVGKVLGEVVKYSCQISSNFCTVGFNNTIMIRKEYF